MFVEKLIHITHVAADVKTRRELENWYLEVFGAQTYYEARPVQGLDRDETLIVIGELCLIPQSSTNLDTEQGRLRASYAGRFAQIALKIPKVAEVEPKFRSHGLHPIFMDPIYNNIFFMTDAKESLGLRYELCAVEMPNDLRIRPGWTPDWWRDSHPLGIERVASLATTVTDLAKAKKFYQEVFEFEHIGDRELPEESANVAAFRVGSKKPFVVEVMQPAGKGTPLAEYTAKFGGGLYSINFKVKSLAKAAEYLESKGVRLVGDQKRRFNIDPRDAFGVTFGFVDRDLLS